MKKAKIAWIAAIALLLIYEVYAILNSAPGDTLSEAVWVYGRHPMVALVVGILIGHFFWQKSRDEVAAPRLPPAPSSPPR